MLINKNTKYNRIFINILITFICILVSIIVGFLQNHSGYGLLFTQPIIFLCVYIFVFSKIVIYDKTRLFFIVLTAISGIRYVLLPLLIVLSSYYGGRSIIEPNSLSYMKSILLMNYELIIIAFFISFMEKKRNNNKLDLRGAIYIKQNKKDGIDFGYFIFYIITFLGIIAYPIVLTSINFILPTSVSHSFEFNFIQNLVIYLIIISKQLLFITLVKKIYTLYLNKQKNIYIILSFILSLLNILIYFETNRSDIIISAIVSFLVLFKLYGKKTKKYLIIMIVVIILIINIVTTSRNHISISSGKNNLIDITDILQVYTGGVYNVAIAVETKQYFPESNNASVLFMDIFRPMIGVNVLVKNLPFNYSNVYFNKRMWINVERRSQILPMIGQGNLFFGFFLSPLFSIIFIRIYYYLEKVRLRSNNIEIFYFLSLVMVRLGFFMGQNTMNMINDMSMNLVLFFVIFYINALLKKDSKYF